MKRTVSLLLAIAMLVLAVASCAPAAPETVEVIKEVTTVVEVEKEVEVEKVVEKEVEVEKVVEVTAGPQTVYEVTFWEHSPWTRAEVSPKQEDFVWEYIRDNYGLDITLVPAPSADADAKLNAMIAAGDMPEIIEAYWGPSNAVSAEFVRQGVLVPIDDHVQAQPYLNEYLTDEEWVYLTYGGNKYGLAQPRPFSNWLTVWVRQDWLENLGLPMPTTVDELAQVAEAFTFDDPDGNGANDTYGFSGQQNFGYMTSYFAPFGAHPGQNVMYIENDDVVFSGFSNYAKEAIRWWKAQLDAGVVDPDWTVHSMDTFREAVAQQRVGIISAEFQFTRNCTSNACFAEIIAAANPEAKWEQVPAIEGPYGTWSAWAGTPVDVQFYFTRSATDEPGKMDAIMRFMNDIMNPDTELYHRVIYGIPGVMYSMDETGRRTHRYTLTSMGWHSYWAVFRRGDEGYFYYYTNETNEFLPDEEGKLLDRQIFSISQPLVPHVTPLVASHPLWPDLNAYMQEMHMKFATGEELLENWDAFVETAKTTYGLDEVMEDAREQLRNVDLLP